MHHHHSVPIGRLIRGTADRGGFQQRRPTQLKRTTGPIVQHNGQQRTHYLQGLTRSTVGIRQVRTEGNREGSIVTAEHQRDWRRRAG